MRKIEIYFLNAEKYSEWKNKQRFLTAENIQAICEKSNWNLVNYDQIKEQDYTLVPNRYEIHEETIRSKEEIIQQIIEIKAKIKVSQEILLSLNSRDYFFNLDGARKQFFKLEDFTNDNKAD